MEDSPVIEPIEEVVAVLVFDSPEPALERDTKEFTKEEDEFDKTFELPEFEKPSRPPIELKLLPFGLRYAFFNSNLVSPIVISNKLSEEDNKTNCCSRKASTCLRLCSSGSQGH